MPNRIYLFFIGTYFAQGMVGLAYVPIAFLLKESLGLSAAESAVFIAWMTLPLLFKPLLGLITDAFPLGGRRRAPYLLMASAATLAGWAALAAMRGYSYWPVLGLLTLVNAGMAFCDVLCDGVMVEHGKKESKTGSYQAAQIGTLYLTIFATGVGGGYLAEHVPYRWVFALTAAFPALIFAATFLVPDKPVPAGRRQARLLWEGLSGFIRSRSFWAACLVIFLFNFSPFLGTPLFYYQSDTLGFSKVFIGVLASVGGAAGALGAGVFWKLLKRRMNVLGKPVRLDTGTLIKISVLAGAPLTLLYLGYRGGSSALLLTAFFGVVGVIMRLSLMDVLARACPRHGEATAFALFMAVFNLAAWASNTIGAKLYDALSGGPMGPHGTLAVLICAGSLCTLSCWPLLRWIPQSSADPSAPPASRPEARAR